MLNNQKIINILSLYEDIGVSYLLEDFTNIISLENKGNSSNDKSKVFISESHDIQDDLSNKNGNSQVNIVDINDNQAIATTIDQINLDLEKINTIEALNEYILNFTLCSIKKTAMHTVLGQGSYNPKVLLLGGVPANEEDESGIAFSGVEGVLLKKMFKNIDNIFMSYSVFWRPPGNRELSFEEIAVCFPIIEKMILILKPKYLILADELSRKLFFPNSTLSSMMTKWHEVKIQNNNIDHIALAKVIFSPKYLINNPLKKKEVWLDLITIYNKINNE